MWLRLVVEEGGGDPPARALAAINQGEAEAAPIVVGRSRDAAVRLEGDLKLSGHHFSIGFEEGRWVVTDLRSRNGTWVGEAALGGGGSVALRQGSVIYAGDARIRAEFLDPPAVRGFPVVGYVGAGSMGVVWQARRGPDGPIVALKTISQDYARHSEARSRMAREAEMLRCLDHPNIPRFVASGETAAGVPYLAMDLVEGRDAEAWCTSLEGMPSPRSCCWVVKQALEAVVHAHERGIVHRDLKLGNLLLTGAPPGGEVKVVDFGIAKRPRDLTLTKRGAVLGDPLTIPPEQAENPLLSTKAADIYALGATLYFLICRTPTRDLEGKPYEEAVRAVRDDEPVPILERRSDLAPCVVGILERAMKREPSERYKSATEMLRAVEGALECLGDGGDPGEGVTA